VTEQIENSQPAPAPGDFEPEDKDFETAPEPVDDDYAVQQIDDSAEIDTTVPEDAGTALRLGALQVSNSQNYVENPLGSNVNPYSRYFGITTPQPWCAYFISFCYDYASNRDRRVPWSAGYSGSFHQYAAPQGWVVTSPMAGDIFVYPNYQHSGIVTGQISLATGQFATVEGNWGDRVYRQFRNFRTNQYYFIRIQQASV
jgi:hypothetical protein